MGETKKLVLQRRFGVTLDRPTTDYICICKIQVLYILTSETMARVSVYLNTSFLNEMI